MDPRPLDGIEWFAVQVWVGREQFTASQLRLRGHDVFLPSYVERRRWSDRMKKTHQALFPGYVFCRLGAADVGRVALAPGVLRIVVDGRGPVPVPRHEVEALQRITEARLAAEPWEFLQSGQRVLVETGPLRGAEAILLVVKNRHKLVVSIPLLRRSVAVEVPSEWVSVPWPVPPDGAGTGPK